MVAGWNKGVDHARLTVSSVRRCRRAPASLEKALARVAKEAKEVPSEVFQTLWRDNLTGFYKTSADPKAQASAFRAERRKICAYAKSMAFQGTGYGIFTTRCELALTQTLLDQLKP